MAGAPCALKYKEAEIPRPDGAIFNNLGPLTHFPQSDSTSFQGLQKFHRQEAESQNMIGTLIRDRTLNSASS